MKANTLALALLILLSAVNFSIGGGSVAGLVLAASGAKAAILGWQFMELRSAHFVWRLALFAFLAVMLGGVYLLDKI